MLANRACAIPSWATRNTIWDYSVELGTCYSSYPIFHQGPALLHTPSLNWDLPCYITHILKGTCPTRDQPCYIHSSYLEGACPAACPTFSRGLPCYCTVYMPHLLSGTCPATVHSPHCKSALSKCQIYSCYWVICTSKGHIYV